MARRGLLVTTLTILISLALVIPAYASYKDVKDQRLTAIIDDLTSKSIVSGFVDGTFRPTQPVTRAQMAKLITSAKQYPVRAAGASVLTFKDVPADHWAFTHISASASAGIVRGYSDSTFRPNAQITRGELARMLTRAMTASTVKTAKATYKDVSAKYWAFSDIETVVHYGVMGGYKDNTFRPAQPATRAEIAVAVHNMLNAKIDPSAQSDPQQNPDPTQASQTSTPAPPSAADDGKIIIAIDPGHGGYDPGAIAPSNKLNEKDVNLSVALKLRDLIVAAGYQVVMTRASDVYVGLSERAQIANNALADLFVSVHHNSNATNTTEGTAVYSFPGSQNGAALAQMIQEELIKSLGWQGVAGKNDGQRSANYVVLRETLMTAVLTESAYLSNPAEAALLATDDFRQREAQGIYNGIIRYLNANNKLSTNSQSGTDSLLTPDGQPGDGVQ